MLLHKLPHTCVEFGDEMHALVTTTGQRFATLDDPEVLKDVQNLLTASEFPKLMFESPIQNFTNLQLSQKSQNLLRKENEKRKKKVQPT